MIVGTYLAIENSSALLHILSIFPDHIVTLQSLDIIITCKLLNRSELTLGGSMLHSSSRHCSLTRVYFHTHHVCRGRGPVCI